MPTAPSSRPSKTKGHQPSLKKTSRRRKPNRVKPSPWLNRKPTWVSPFGKQSVAWMVTQLRMAGGLHFSPSNSFYFPLTITDPSSGELWLHPDFLILCGLRPRVATRSADRIKKQIEPFLTPRKILPKRPSSYLEWQPAYGSKKVLQDKARYYLRLIDFKVMETFDSKEIVLAKTVCNLRNYYKQSKVQTVELITTIYNPLCGINWSEEDIELTWDLAGGLPPTLWLIDERYLSHKKRTIFQWELRSLLECLTPGGKVLVPVMQKLVQEWDPSLNATPREIGDAMRAVTGKASEVSNGVSYYYGFQLPLRQDPIVEAALRRRDMQVLRDLLMATRYKVNPQPPRSYCRPLGSWYGLTRFLIN